MRKLTMGAAMVLSLVAVAAGAEQHESIFDQLHALEAAAAADRDLAAQRTDEVATLDRELENHWAALDVALRAARPIRVRVTQSLARWLSAHRTTDREAMGAPVAAADTRRLLHYAAEHALPTQLRNADVVRRADSADAAFGALLAHRAGVSIDLARARSTAMAASDAREVFLGQARAGNADADLNASDAAFDALLRDLAVAGVQRDFHRSKGTLARPIATRPEYHFGARAPLMRPSGWTYRPLVGADVHAVGAGQVVFVGDVEGRGLTVVLEHGGGYRSTYSHVAAATVQVGDDVGRADVVASAGDSGSLDGVRLYFELRRHGIPVDPAGWFLKD